MKNLLKKLNEQCGKIYPGKKYEDLNEFDKLLVESTLEEFDVDRDRDEELYPIEFEGKLWYKEDCDEMFQMFYTVGESLIPEICAVYVSAGMCVKPNGKFCEY